MNRVNFLTVSCFQLAAGDLQSTMSIASGAGIDRPTSAPIPGGLSVGGLTSGPVPLTPTFSSDAVPTRSLTSASKGKGMQLGATKMATSASSVPDWAEEAAAELETTKGNPWGNDDLMDVNADDDDWSECH